MNSTYDHLQALLKSGWTQAEIARVTKIEASVLSRWATHGLPAAIIKAQKLHKLKPRRSAATKSAA